MSGEASNTDAQRRALIESYLKRGFKLIPYPPKQKGPSGPAAVDWHKKPIEKKEDIDPSLNHGVLLGVEISEGKYIVDIDFDYQEGMALGKKILPPTSFAFGRGDKTVTHGFHTTDRAVPSKAYADISGKMLVELRGAKKNGDIGNQTMLPPSIHPSGETVELRINGEIGHAPDIERQVTLYAICCILHYHLGAKGLTHEVRLALAGFLLQQGVQEHEAVLIGEALAAATGNTVEDVKLTVQTTAERVEAREKVKGKAALIKALGDDGKAIVSRIVEWLGNAEFVCNANSGAVIANHYENLVQMLRRLDVTLSYDEFGQQMFCTRNGAVLALDDAVRDRLWFDIQRQFGCQPSSEFFDAFLRDRARENSFNPVIRYLDSVIWDGVPRLDGWLTRFGGAADTEYVRAVGSLVLIAAVRRARQPGAKFDEMLVLESPQGQMKSSALQALCPEEDWFSDDLPLNVDTKELIERTLGKWIVEASDLQGYSRSDVDRLKAMLSRRIDGPVRMAYGRMPIKRARQFVLVGTTNSHEYLKDSTGNRRFWPVRVGTFDVKALRADRDQLWAEAAARESKGESIRLDPALYPLATLQQERRRQRDPWEIRLADRFPRDQKWRLTWDEIYQAVGLSIDRRTEATHTRLLKAMQLLGFKSMVVAVKKDDGHETGRKERGMGRDEDAPAQEPLFDAR